ncbi:MAG: alpha/beta hydrolase, partial [Thermoplasmata archaeon]
GPKVRENLPKFVGQLSMQSHADELAGAVRTALAERGVAGDRLFVLTNSEGAIHAVNYQLRGVGPHFRGLVLTGAPGRAIGAVVRSQFVHAGRGLPNVEDLLKCYDAAISEFLADRPIRVDPSLPEGVQQVLLSLQTPANLPFARELWTYDLASTLARVQEPVLVVIGKKDLQTDWKADGTALREALAKNRSATFSYPENANHVLKLEPTPVEALVAEKVVARYNAPDVSLDPEAAKVIVDWLRGQTA